MATARKRQISLVDTKYYHCISRCVRRAFLCGEDFFTGKSYEHRKQWVEDKILQLSQIFCIDVCAYAVMSNHLHLVLHANDEKAEKIDDKAVLFRWHKLFKGTFLTQKFMTDEELTDAEQITLKETISVYRKRLFSISWFMRSLNENIARKANKEDDCTGRFWEGRFKSQALLDEAALAACMAYVDLNPLRARAAKTLENSGHTSIKKRIESAKIGKQPSCLFPLTGNRSIPEGLPFDFKSYIQLIEVTGQCIQNSKSTMIDKTEPMLKKLNISPENWIKLTTQFTRVFHGAVGRKKVMQKYCHHLKLRRRPNLTQCQRLLA